MLSYGSSATEGVRDALRFLLDRVPEARPLDGGGELLERAPAPLDRPRTLSARILEGTTLRPKRIRGSGSSVFGAFLDGIQRSRVALHLPGGVPVVVASVAAVVRRRIDRRLVTWAQDARRKLYLPLSLIRDGPRLGAELEHVVVDTSQPFSGDDGPESRHPLALLERAVHFAQADRELLEIALAERWCSSESTPLFIDGGISGSERLATSPKAVGVVKSHRRLYAENEGLEIVFGLAHGERTSVFRVESSRRSSVASWYLRLRDPAGHDPMWGLVRVEIPDDGAGAAERADEVSGWILAEVTPLSLPDARWDKMVYGIRDCEEFLRAVG